MVSNKNGIFLTYLKSNSEDYRANAWRLLHSNDGEESFRLVYESVDATSAPVMETDQESGDLFLWRPDWNTYVSYFHRFQDTDGLYGTPTTFQLDFANTGKYSMAYDPAARRIVVASSWDPSIIARLDPISGQIETSTCVASARYDASGSYNAEYPQVAIGPGGSLIFAYTTCFRPADGSYFWYWDIRALRTTFESAGVAASCLYAPDAWVWKSLKGEVVPTPIEAIDERITKLSWPEDEDHFSDWLEGLLVKDGKLHATYQALERTNPEASREHYQRYDLATGEKEIDIFPTVHGETLRTSIPDGAFSGRFLTGDLSVPESPIYLAALSDRDTLIVLASDDQGATWYDYAESPETFSTGVGVYALGGNRRIVRDGLILGSMTYLGRTPEGVISPSLVFFKVQAGLSTAWIEYCQQDGRGLHVRFSGIRGQPRWVRFAGTDGRYSPWLPFAEEMATRFLDWPERFQLRSRMGVDSTALPFPQQA